MNKAKKVTVHRTGTGGMPKGAAARNPKVAALKAVVVTPDFTPDPLPR